MRGDHKDSERTDRHSSRVASAASPVQKSPNTPTPAAQPVQNSPNTPKKAHFSQFCTSRENFVPLAPPRPPAGRTLSRTQRQTRYKTLPTRPRQQPNRYKTLPAHPKLPISARFARAGRTLYRSHHHAPQQGELCTAPSTKPGTKLSQHAPTSSPTGTKLSQHAQKGPFQPVLHEQGELCPARTTTTPSRENFVPHQAPNPVQNSPNTPTPAAQPVQNSPNTHKKAHFSLFCPSRENYVPLAPPRPPAGRTLYRAQRQTRYKTLPAQPVRRPNRYKTLPTRPHQQPNRYKTLPAHPASSPTGTKLPQHAPSHIPAANKLAQHT